MKKSGRAGLVRRVGRVRLFPAVVSALGVGVFVAVAAYLFLRWITPTSEAKAAPIDITKVALTVVAGVGGVVALVIAYRRQRDVEQSRFVERFGAAAAQLGATDVAVRIAGVYAMSGVADEADGLGRQQCIDVLCGYLRLPYSPDFGGNHQTKRVKKRSAGEGTGEDEDHFEYRQNDREVRATIVRVIADHLRAEAEYSWSTSDFDFRTAYLEDADFRSVTFSGAARFDDSTFSGTAAFREATFNGTAAFRKATFNDTATFNEATFSSIAVFGEAWFSGDAMFGRASFSGDALFEKAMFDGDALFEKATFDGDALFGEAMFSSTAAFRKATFYSTAAFREATFNGTAAFRKATFYSTAAFGKATFNSTAGFVTAIFDGGAWFGEATFKGDARFGEAAFNGKTWFDQALFIGRTSFMATNFGSERIVFTGPRQWGPPSPEFDWREDGVGKPVNVEPRDWPPIVTAS